MNAPLPRSPRALALVLAVAGTVAAAVAGPAGAASAATVSIDRGCYVTSDSAVGAPMTVTGTGFTPGETVDVTGHTVDASAVADSLGDFAVTTPAPILSTPDPGAITTTLTASGQTSRATATVAVHSANLAMLSVPGTVTNVRRDKAKFMFSGFVPGKRIYGFYTHGRKTVRTNFGVAAGPCGTRVTHALLFPGGRPRYEIYKVAFQSAPHLSASAHPSIRGTLTLLRF